MAQNRVGTPVRGDDLYGRDAFVQLVSEKLKTGHVLLAAPRRFGKTSVMFRLIDKPAWNYRVIDADLEHFTEASELLTRLIELLARDDKLAKLLNGLSWVPNKLWTFFRDNVDEVGLLEVKLKLKAQLRESWQERGEAVFRLVAQSPATVVFILDEFPMMIDRMARSKERREEAITLLRWLRALRLSPETTNVRFLVAGSIGIEQILNQLGEIKSINDFEKMRLEPFTPKVAAAFLDELARSHDLPLSPACKRKMLELVGTGVPYFLQILFSEVAKSHALDGEAITPKKIERIYRDKVLGVDCKSYFEHYYGRLRDYYQPDEERAAKRILRELAKEPQGLTREACWQFFREIVGRYADIEDFNRLMTDLENDFYVRFDAEARRYEFACKLLRDWWLRHYGMDAGA
jgi:uncharacterized protein